MNDSDYLDIDLKSSSRKDYTESIEELYLVCDNLTWRNSVGNFRKTEGRIGALLSGTAKQSKACEIERKQSPTACAL